MGVARRFVGALLLGLVVLAAAGFATGRVASVVTNGVSMQPAYEAGDFVVVARVGRYEAGDVVAYREPDSGEVVLHRIVGGSRDAFELQGDNNQSIDTATPGAGDLIGRQVLHVPEVGRWIGSPLAMACIAGLLIGLLSLLTLGGGSHRAVPDDADEDVLAGVGGARALRWRWWHGLLLALDLGAIGGLAAAFMIPPTVVPAPPVPMHVGALSYTADVASSDTYPDGLVETGDSVFLRLVDQLSLAFAYEGDPDLTASARLRVQVTSAAGWNTTVPLTPLTPVFAGGVELRGTLDLAHLRAMLDRVNDATGIPVTTVELRVQAIVEPTTDDPAVTTSVSEMVFRFDDIVADLVDSTEVSASMTGPAVTTTSPVRDTAVGPTEVGGVPREARRWLVVALLVLVAATASSWPTGERRRGARTVPADDPVQVTAVTDVELPPGVMRVRLACRADLERLARGGGTTMLVRDDGWCAVVSERAMHWWSPEMAPVPAQSPAAPARSAGLDDVWTIEAPTFGCELPLASQEPPTVERLIDVVDRLRDSTFVPRRPLFAARPTAQTPQPRRKPPPTHPPTAPDQCDPEDPVRTTIDEIVAYLAEAAPRPHQGTRDLAS